jgi:hypothetical protein
MKSMKLVKRGSVCVVLLSIGFNTAKASYCAAPCSYTFNDPFPPPLALCSGTVTETAGVPFTHPATDYQGIFDTCNVGRICPSEPTPAPSQHIHYDVKKTSEQKYSLGGTAHYEIFGLNANYSSATTETTDFTIDFDLVGWCQCKSGSIAETIVTSSVSVTFTPVIDIAGACELDTYVNGVPFTATLDTRTLAYRSDAVTHQAYPPAGCKTTCP